MNTFTRQTTTSPLIRRVRRHQEISTLFQGGHSAPLRDGPVQRSIPQPAAPSAWLMGTIAEPTMPRPPELVDDTALANYTPETVLRPQALTQFPVAQMVESHPGKSHTPSIQPQADEAFRPSATGMKDIVQTQPVASVPHVSSSQPAMQGGPDQPVSDPSPPSLAAAVPPHADPKTSSNVTEPAPPSAEPVSPPAADSTPDDRTWMRLEAIMAAHRRKEQGGMTAPPTPQPTSSRIQRQARAADAAQSPHVARQQESVAAADHAAAELPAVESEPDVLQAATSTNPRNETDAAHLTGQSAVNPESETHDKKAKEALLVAGTANMSGNDTVVAKQSQVPHAARQSSPQGEVAQVLRQQPPAASASYPMQRQVDGSPSGEPLGDPPVMQASTQVEGTEPEATNQEPRQDVQPDPVRQNSGSLPGTVDAVPSETPATATRFDTEPPSAPDDQLVPLQEAWPGVQQVATLDNATDATANIEGESDASPEEFSSGAYTERAEVSNAVQAALRQVETAQPTESTVHVIPPRRPRPQVQRKLPEGKDGNQSRPESPAETSYSQTADVVDEDSWNTPSPEPAAGQDIAPTPALIETEIGAMPEDLWRLIDEPLPKDSITEDTPAQARAEAVPPAKHATEQSLSTTVIQTQPTASVPAETDEPISAEKSLNSVSPVTGQGSRQPTPGLVPLNRTDGESSQLPGDETVSNELENAEHVSEPIDAISKQAGRPTDSASERTSTAQRSHSAPEKPELPTTESITADMNSTGNINRSVVSSNPMDTRIQRQPDDQPPAVTVEESSKLAGSGGDEDSAPTQTIDTDELAREVYSKLRQRLIVENERLGI